MGAIVDEPAIDDISVRRRLEAARGFCELGLPDMAWEEIQPVRMVPSGERIEVELMVQIQRRKWEEALALSAQLRQMHPASPLGFIHGAYCLHEVGRTSEALTLLNDGPKSMRQEALYFYNAACYLAVLGRHDEAVKAVRKALQMDESYRANAKEDPDLAAVRHLI